MWNQPRPVGLILIYHRVADLRSDPQLLAVSRRRFSAQMAYLSEHCEVVSLHDLLSQIGQSPSPERPFVAVTFDDGYADNLIYAKPILEASRIPATIFVTSGYLGGTEQFWWDELESLCLHPSSLPTLLRLTVQGRTYEWDIESDASYSPQQFEVHQDWNVLRKDDPTSRHRVYRALCTLLRPMAQPERQETLRAIRDWAGARQVLNQACRTLTREEVQSLALGPWVEVGAHTESHPVLAQLPIDSQRLEIKQSKQCLEGLLARPVKSFAYPFGTRSDYNEETSAIVREQGFELACSNIPECVTRGTDQFQLPRFVVRNWDVDRFERTLKSWWVGLTEDAHYSQ